MRDPSPNITELPLVGLGAEEAWPIGIGRGASVYKRDALTVWAGKASPHVSVTILDKSAEGALVSDFLEAVHRLEEEGKGLSGVLQITSSDVAGRWVVHTPVLGVLVDVPSLGWKLKRKLSFFKGICKIVAALHAKDIAHGALTPWSVALDEEMTPLLVSPSGLSMWDPPPGFEYLVPELLLGAPPTVKSDVFALGRVLAFLLLGSHPPPEKDAVPRLDYLKEAPAGLTRIIRRATVGNPEFRYDSVEELIADVEDYGNFEKVGLALATAVELNKSGLSKPPQALAPRPRPPEPKEVAAPAGPKTGPYAKPKPVSESTRKRQLVAAGLAAITLILLAFGDPIFVAVERWRARRAVAAAPSGEKGQAIARLAALGDRELSGMHLSGVDFSTCSLSGVSFADADLTDAKLDNADLGEANLVGATLTNASARGAVLDNANITNTKGLETVTCDELTLPPPAWECVNGHLAPEGPHAR